MVNNDSFVGSFENGSLNDSVVNDGADGVWAFLGTPDGGGGRAGFHGGSSFVFIRGWNAVSGAVPLDDCIAVVPVIPDAVRAAASAPAAACDAAGDHLAAWVGDGPGWVIAVVAAWIFDVLDGQGVAFS
ncbi:MAG: hypothetical protein ACOYJ1_00945 [Peptococcales bacterium]